MNLLKLYTDLSFPGSYSGINRFYRYAKKVYPGLKLHEVKEFLQSNDAYTIHREKRNVKKFRRIYTKGIGYQYNLDLIDLQAYSRENKGYRYILNIIGETRPHDL